MEILKIDWFNLTIFFLKNRKYMFNIERRIWRKLSVVFASLKSMCKIRHVPVKSFSCSISIIRCSIMCRLPNVAANSCGHICTSFSLKLTRCALSLQVFCFILNMHSKQVWNFFLSLLIGLWHRHMVRYIDEMDRSEDARNRCGGQSQL